MNFLILFCAFFFIVAVISLGIIIPRDSCSKGCFLENIEWFTTRCICKAHNINCRQQQLIGADLADTFKKLDRQLSVLVITECQGVRMPAELQQLTQLYGIKLFNSSITSWGTEAALHQEIFSQLGYIYFFYTNLTEIPSALLVQLPDSLMDIEFAHTPLQTLPISIVEYWSNVESLYIEYGNLSQVPPILKQFTNVVEISLSGNPIYEFPDDLLISMASFVQSLVLIKVPLNYLALDLINATTFFIISVDYTNISATALSESLQQSLSYITAEGTPWCKDLPRDSNMPRCITGCPDGWIPV